VKIEEVEGIGDVAGGKLRDVGINTTDDLLMAAGSAAGRAKVSGMTGISEGQLLKWANHVDLMRLPGVGSEYSELLEAAGVDSPAELAQRNAANLAQTFQELDAARPNWIRRIPSQETVEEWIAAAKGMEKAVSH
jgi:predicted flap endonuclease-1-like 5' DNA nuclease